MKARQRLPRADTARHFPVMRRILVALGCTLLAFAPRSVEALSIDPPVAPFHDHLGHRGAYEFLGVGNGLPATATVRVGEVGPTDVTVVFRIALDAGSLELPNFFVQAIGGSDPLAPIALVGAGVLATAGRGVAAMGIDVDATGLPILAWLFDGSLLEGEASVLLFASWAGLQTGDRVGTILPTMPPRDPPFGRRDFFGGTVVPEPGTALLLGFGLLLTRSSRPAPR